jgi:hypothetical protein
MSKCSVPWNQVCLFFERSGQRIGSGFVEFTSHEKTTAVPMRLPIQKISNHPPSKRMESLFIRQNDSNEKVKVVE